MVKRIMDSIKGMATKKDGECGCKAAGEQAYVAGLANLPALAPTDETVRLAIKAAATDDLRRIAAGTKRVSIEEEAELRRLAR